MEHLTTLQLLLGLLLALLALTALAASVTAYFKASYVKATVQTLQENNAALTERVATLKAAAEDAERERLAQTATWEAERTKDRARIQALETENTTLRDVIQGRADLANVVDEIQQHHHAVMEDAATFRQEWRGEVGKVTGGLDDLLTAAGSIGTDVRAVKGMVTRQLAPSTGGTTR